MADVLDKSGFQGKCVEGKKRYDGSLCCGDIAQERTINSMSRYLRFHDSFRESRDEQLVVRPDHGERKIDYIVGVGVRVRHGGRSRAKTVVRGKEDSQYQSPQYA